MNPETTRRHFLRGGTLATAGLLGAAAGTEPPAKPEHDHHHDKGEVISAGA